MGGDRSERSRKVDIGCKATVYAGGGERYAGEIQRAMVYNEPEGRQTVERACHG